MDAEVRKTIDEIYRKHCEIPDVMVTITDTDGVWEFERAAAIADELEEEAKGEDWTPTKKMVCERLCESITEAIRLKFGVLDES